MFENRLQKQAIQMLLDRDGRDVTINTVEYISEDGARRKEENTFNLTVALFYDMSYATRESDDAGERMVDTWTGVTDENPGFDISTLEQAVLEDPQYGTFNVVDMTPVMMSGETAGYGLELERVK